MAELLTADMKSLIAELGELVKADPRNESIRQAIEDYERSEDLNALIAEYNAQQSVLTDAYAGESAPDEAVTAALQQRIELYAHQSAFGEQRAALLDEEAHILLQRIVHDDQSLAEHGAAFGPA